jgi:ABC-2 type transport system ATP-binding protein
VTDLAEPAEAASHDQVIADGLVKRFGDFVAVDHVSFRIARGEIMGFLGPNGAGKSTIIRILCGLLRLSGGRAIVAGIDVAQNPEGVRQRIGYMSQKFSLYRDLTVSENLRFFGGIYGVPRAELAERIRFAVDMAGLAGREDALVGTLAGGWQQRLALGCAVLHRPPILFLDEPTSGVEPASRRRFWDLIHSLASDGVTVLVSTHYMEEAEYCNRAALINHGRLIAMDSPAALKRTALGGELLLIETDALGPTLAALHDAPGVRDSSVFGNSLHVLVGDAATSLAVLPEYLAARGLRPRRIAPIAASLEDVFVQLIAADAATRRTAA